MNKNSVTIVLVVIGLVVIGLIVWQSVDKTPVTPKPKPVPAPPTGEKFSGLVASYR